MARSVTGFVLVGLIFVGGVGAARGGEYADPSGFSITYPDGWVVVNRAAMSGAQQALPPEMRDWVAKNKLDLSKVAVMVVRNGQEDFLENLNVVVNNQQIPTDDNAVKQLTAAMPGQYAAMGAQVTNIQGRVQKVASRDAVVVEYDARLPGVETPLRQRQVALPGGGKTYIVTCTARADTFDKYQPTFDAVLASFKAPAPAGFDWSRVFSTGVIGGLIGLVVAVVLGVMKKKPKPGPAA